MKLISWNVNGLRACLTHDFAASFAALDADVFSVQETKMQPGQADFAPEGYTEYTYSAEKKGYSGTACWCKTVPLSVTTGIGIEEHDHEGRVLTLEYPEFYLVNCYTPNSQDGLKRLDYRMTWEDAFRAYLLELDAKKPVILCGDLNVAHEEIDIDYLFYRNKHLDLTKFSPYYLLHIWNRLILIRYIPAYYKGHLLLIFPVYLWDNNFHLYLKLPGQQNYEE